MNVVILPRIVCRLPLTQCLAVGLTQIQGDHHNLLLEGGLVYLNSDTFGYQYFGRRDK